MKWRTIKKKTHQSVTSSTQTHIRYAGFWSRVLATIIDIFMLGMPVALLTSIFLGYDATHEASFMSILEGKEPQTPPNPLPALVNMAIFLLIYVTMWYKLKGQTPGKKFARIAVVDSKTFKTASLLQLIIRFLAYALSFISLIGFFLPLLLPKKQALHDLLSRTVVIYYDV